MSELFVSSSKQKLLQDRLTGLGVQEADLQERFILGSGKGGQKINKTSSCVHLRHLPTGLEVKCQAGRSQGLNRYHARVMLCEKLEERIRGATSARKQEQEKIRRQKRRRSRRQKVRMLEVKRRHSEKKGARRWRGSEE